MSSSLFTQPNEIAPYLPLVHSYYHKLLISSKPEFSAMNSTETTSTTVSESTPTSAEQNTTPIPTASEEK